MSSGYESPVDAIRFDALRLAKGLTPTASNIQKVAASTNGEAASWAFTQWELRGRAKAKFRRAKEMLFDRDGLEMASHEALAAYHASLFPFGVRVADLTAGIGSDLIALADGREALGFEVDAQRIAYARHNLAVYGREANLEQLDCLSARWDFDYAFADPSRRTRAGRTAEPDDFLPPLVDVAKRMAQLDAGAIKLSPMLTDTVLADLSGSIEFLSFGRECREAVALLGDTYRFQAVEKGPRFKAIHIESGEALPGGPVTVGPVEVPGARLFEMDPAAIRAHAAGVLSRLAGVEPLGDSNGYLTSDSDFPGRWAVWVRSYRVLAFGRADEKAIKAALRSLDARVEAVKVRGVKEDPIAWKKRIGRAGAVPVVLVLYPVGKSLRYAFVEPDDGPGKNT